MVGELLQTKWDLPGPPHGHVSRPRIDKMLAGGADHRLTFVTGGPGTGKTVAVAAWLATEGRPHLWLSLDVDDDDPNRLLAYLRGGLATRLGLHVETGPGDERNDDPSPTDQVVSLLNRLADDSRDLVVAIDDVHLLTDAATLDALSLLVRRLPANVQLVLAGRTEPDALGLHRLRGTDDLLEVGPDVLRFRPDEGADLLRLASGRVLSPDTTGKLVDRAAGWAVALRLAARGLDRCDDPGTFADRFDGTDHRVRAYVEGEVLDALDAGTRHALVQLAPLDEVCGPLARAVTGLPDAPDLLGDLEGAGALVRIDGPGGWYRPQPLVSDVLRQDLAAESPDVACASHRRAAAWLEADGRDVSAFDHHVAAGDLDDAWALLSRLAVHLEDVGEGDTLTRWLESIGPDYVAERPDRLLDLAVALSAGTHAAASLDATLRAEPMLSPEDRAGELGIMVQGLKATAQLQLGDPAGAARSAARVLDADLSSVDAELVARFYAVIIRAHAWIGDTTGGWAIWDRARAERGVEIADQLAYPSALAQLCLAEGQLTLAEQHARAAIEGAERIAHPSHVWAADSRTALAYVLFERNQLAAARAALDGNPMLGRSDGRGDVLQARHLHARLLAAEGDHAAAFDEIAAIRRLRVPGLGLPPTWQMWTDLIEARMRLDVGDLRTGRRLVNGLPDTPRTGVLRCRLRLAEGDVEGARAAVAGLAPPASIGARLHHELLLAATCRTDPEGRRHLHAALDLAEPEGYVRLFLELPPTTAQLLFDVAGTRSGELAATLAHELLQAGPAAGRTAPNEPLTSKEQAVLQLLPTHLTNNELAQRLRVSVNTLKTHVKNLYRKLGVTSRSEAVDAARALGLLQSDRFR